jgi:hypothetical protein
MRNEEEARSSPAAQKVLVVVGNGSKQMNSDAKVIFIE